MLPFAKPFPGSKTAVSLGLGSTCYFAITPKERHASVVESEQAVAQQEAETAAQVGDEMLYGVRVVLLSDRDPVAGVHAVWGIRDGLTRDDFETS